MTEVAAYILTAAYGDTENVTEYEGQILQLSTNGAGPRFPPSSFDI